MKSISTVILLICTGMLLTAQDRETAPVTLQKITDNIYQINGGQGANGGLIVCETGLVVIDSKMDEESVNQTLEAIRGLTDKPIRYLVNTHSDGDHIMGNRWFPVTVTFVAHENCRDDFFKENFGRASDWGEPEFYPFTPSVTFREKMDLWIGKELIELHYFGVGHTTGDIIVYVPEEKIAFIGDQYFSGRPQLIHSVKNGNSFAYVNTMKKMLEKLEAETFLSGHSDPVGRGEIKEHIRKMEDRQVKVKELIGQDKDLEEVLAAFDENESRLVTSIYQEISNE
jgi:cyclase